MIDDNSVSYSEHKHVLSHIPGVSLRDWFAGEFVSGYFAGKNVPARGSIKEGQNLGEWVAEQAYALADAMLKARIK